MKNTSKYFIEHFLIENQIVVDTVVGWIPLALEHPERTYWMVL